MSCDFMAGVSGGWVVAGVTELALGYPFGEALIAGGLILFSIALFKAEYTQTEQ